MKYTGYLPSRLSKAGTSIFAVMSGLAGEVGAINLSQGFPDFEISPELIELVHKHMREGRNQYAPMAGVFALREAIARKTFVTYGIEYHADNEITITAGATEAIYSIITSMINAGDEAIIFEPAYDSYAPAVELSGGVVRYSSLQLPDFTINWPQVERLVNNRTKLILINSPHNPTGSVLKPADLAELQRITANTNIVVLSDEVYEHLIFDGLRHESVCYYPELASRTFVVGSFGKTFHTTGWKTGFVLAPAELTAEMRKVHQFVVFASNTPVQFAVAEFLNNEENYIHLPEFYQQKRDLFARLVSGSRFRIVPASGTYFQLLDFSDITKEKELDFAIRLTREHGIASVPVSPFYHNKQDNHLLRFCFAKTEETLTKAAEILCTI